MLSFYLLKEKKKKGEIARGLFSHSRHALLAVLAWDFPSY
jgi:hypothetical protein